MSNGCHCLTVHLCGVLIEFLMYSTARISLADRVPEVTLEIPWDVSADIPNAIILAMAFFTYFS